MKHSLLLHDKTYAQGWSWNIHPSISYTHLHPGTPRQLVSQSQVYGHTNLESPINQNQHVFRLWKESHGRAWKERENSTLKRPQQLVAGSNPEPPWGNGANRPSIIDSFAIFKQKFWGSRRFSDFFNIFCLSVEKIFSRGADIEVWSPGTLWQSTNALVVC